jgi:hypothetical protein
MLRMSALTAKSSVLATIGKTRSRAAAVYTWQCERGHCSKRRSGMVLMVGLDRHRGGP